MRILLPAALALLAAPALATPRALTEAEARSLAEASSRAEAAQRQSQTATARTGDQRAAQTTEVGGQQASVSGSVTIEGDRNPASTAIAPPVVANPGYGNAECYWTLAVAGAGQGATRGVSGGAGLFPFRLETCLLLTLADRHMDGYCADPASDACRLIRRVEESLR